MSKNKGPGPSDLSDKKKVASDDEPGVSADGGSFDVPHVPGISESGGNAEIQERVSLDAISMAKELTADEAQKLLAENKAYQAHNTEQANDEIKQALILALVEQTEQLKALKKRLLRDKEEIYDKLDAKRLEKGSYTVGLAKRISQLETQIQSVSDLAQAIALASNAQSIASAIQDSKLDVPELNEYVSRHEANKPVRILTHSEEASLVLALQLHEARAQLVQNLEYQSHNAQQSKASVKADLIAELAKQFREFDDKRKRLEKDKSDVYSQLKNDLYSKELDKAINQAEVQANAMSDLIDKIIAAPDAQAIVDAIQAANVEIPKLKEYIARHEAMKPETVLSSEEIEEKRKFLRRNEKEGGIKIEFISASDKVGKLKKKEPEKREIAPGKKVSSKTCLDGDKAVDSTRSILESDVELISSKAIQDPSEIILKQFNNPAKPVKYILEQEIESLEPVVRQNESYQVVKAAHSSGPAKQALLDRLESELKSLREQAEHLARKESEAKTPQTRERRNAFGDKQDAKALGVDNVTSRERSEAVGSIEDAKAKGADVKKEVTPKATQPYNVVVSATTMEQAQQYIQALKQKEKQPGGHLASVMEKKGISIDDLTPENLVDLLLKTKQPRIFAESPTTTYDQTTWTADELSLLGDISMSMDVDVYDNGQWKSPTPFETPMKAGMLYTPGALLSHPNSPDVKEVTKDGKLDRDAFKKLYERRLLPMLLQADRDCKLNNHKGFVAIPGLGCGVFAGIYKDQVVECFPEIVREIINENKDNLKNIAGFVCTPDHRIKPQTFDGPPAIMIRNPHETPLLAHPSTYGEAYKDCKLFKVVAWDHVSWPGNDFYSGNTRATDDGVSAAATSTIQQVTGVAGHYEDGRYLPPTTGDWEQYVKSNNLELSATGRIQVYSPSAADVSKKADTVATLMDTIRSANSSEAIVAAIESNNPGVAATSEYVKALQRAKPDHVVSPKVLSELQQLLTERQEVLGRIDATEFMIRTYCELATKHDLYKPISKQEGQALDDKFHLSKATTIRNGLLDFFLSENNLDSAAKNTSQGRAFGKYKTFKSRTFKPDNPSNNGWSLITTQRELKSFMANRAFMRDNLENNKKIILDNLKKLEQKEVDLSAATPKDSAALKENREQQQKYLGMLEVVNAHLEDLTKLENLFDAITQSPELGVLRQAQKDIVDAAYEEMEAYEERVEAQAAVAAAHIELPSDESKGTLDIAAYVAMNCCKWETPVEVGAYMDPHNAQSFTMRRHVGGNLVLDEVQLDMQRGKGYVYHTDGIQGLTRMSPTDIGEPALYATMAPDQYVLPNPQPLPDETVERVLKEILPEDLDAAKYADIKARVSKIVFKEPIQFSVEMEQVLKQEFDIRYQSSDRLKADRILQKVPGIEHVKGIRDIAGPYYAITLGGRRFSEFEGFDDRGRTQSYESAAVVDENMRAMRIFNADNPETADIQKHMVIRSDSETIERPGYHQQALKEKLTIMDDGFEQMVGLYNDAKKNQKPIIVNCTDGIDRTGVTIMALATLKHFEQNPGFLEQSPIEQKHALVGLIEQLRKQRGPAFFAGEEDITRGVALGYALIATQKLLQFETTLPQDLKYLIPEERTNASYGLLLNKLNDISPSQPEIEQWKQLLEERLKAEASFQIANDSDSKFTKDIEHGKPKRDIKQDAVPIEKASIRQLLESKQKGFDLSYIIKDGKNINQIALLAVLRDQNPNNIKMLKEFLPEGTSIQNVLQTMRLTQLESATPAFYAECQRQGVDLATLSIEGKSGFELSKEAFLKENSLANAHAFMAIMDTMPTDTREQYLNDVNLYTSISLAALNQIIDYAIAKNVMLDPEIGLLQISSIKYAADKSVENFKILNDVHNKLKAQTLAAKKAPTVTVPKPQEQHEKEMRHLARVRDFASQNADFSEAAKKKRDELSEKIDESEKTHKAQKETYASFDRQIEKLDSTYNTLFESGFMYQTNDFELIRQIINHVEAQKINTPEQVDLYRILIDAYMVKPDSDKHQLLKTLLYSGGDKAFGAIKDSSTRFFINLAENNSPLMTKKYAVDGEQLDLYQIAYARYLQQPNSTSLKQINELVEAGGDIAKESISQLVYQSYMYEHKAHLSVLLDDFLKHPKKKKIDHFAQILGLNETVKRDFLQENKATLESAFKNALEALQSDPQDLSIMAQLEWMDNFLPDESKSSILVQFVDTSFGDYYALLDSTIEGIENKNKPDIEALTTSWNKLQTLRQFNPEAFDQRLAGKDAKLDKYATRLVESYFTSAIYKNQNAQALSQLHRIYPKAVEKALKAHKKEFAKRCEQSARDSSVLQFESLMLIGMMGGKPLIAELQKVIRDNNLNPVFGKLLEYQIAKADQRENIKAEITEMVGQINSGNLSFQEKHLFHEQLKYLLQNLKGQEQYADLNQLLSQITGFSASPNDLNAYLRHNDEANIIILDIDETIETSFDNTRFVMHEAQMAKALSGSVVCFATDKGCNDLESEHPALFRFLKQNNIMWSTELVFDKKSRTMNMGGMNLVNIMAAIEQMYLRAKKDDIPIEKQYEFVIKNLNTSFGFNITELEADSLTLTIPGKANDKYNSISFDINLASIRAGAKEERYYCPQDLITNINVTTKSKKKVHFDNVGQVGGGKMPHMACVMDVLDIAPTSSVENGFMQGASHTIDPSRVYFADDKTTFIHDAQTAGVQSSHAFSRDNAMRAFRADDGIMDNIRNNEYLNILFSNIADLQRALPEEDYLLIEKAMKEYGKVLYDQFNRESGYLGNDTLLEEFVAHIGKESQKEIYRRLSSNIGLVSAIKDFSQSDHMREANAKLLEAIQACEKKVLETPEIGYIEAMPKSHMPLLIDSAKHLNTEDVERTATISLPFKIHELQYAKRFSQADLKDLLELYHKIEAENKESPEIITESRKAIYHFLTQKYSDPEQLINFLNDIEGYKAFNTAASIIGEFTHPTEDRLLSTLHQMGLLDAKLCKKVSDGISIGFRKNKAMQTFVDDICNEAVAHQAMYHYLAYGDDSAIGQQIQRLNQASTTIKKARAGSPLARGVIGGKAPTPEQKFARQFIYYLDPTSPIQFLSPAEKDAYMHNEVRKENQYGYKNVAPFLEGLKRQYGDDVPYKNNRESVGVIMDGVIYCQEIIKHLEGEKAKLEDNYAKAHIEGNLKEMEALQLELALKDGYIAALSDKMNAFQVKADEFEKSQKNIKRTFNHLDTLKHLTSGKTGLSYGKSKALNELLLRSPAALWLVHQNRVQINELGFKLVQKELSQHALDGMVLNTLGMIQQLTTEEVIQLLTEIEAIAENKAQNQKDVEELMKLVEGIIEKHPILSEIKENEKVKAVKVELQIKHFEKILSDTPPDEKTLEKIASYDKLSIEVVARFLNEIQTFTQAHDASLGLNEYEILLKATEAVMNKHSNPESLEYLAVVKTLKTALQAKIQEARKEEVVANLQNEKSLAAMSHLKTFSKEEAVGLLVALNSNVVELGDDITIEQFLHFNKVMDSIISKSSSPDELKGVPVVQMLLTEMPRKLRGLIIQALNNDILAEDSIALLGHVKLTKEETVDLMVILNGKMVALGDNITLEQYEQFNNLLHGIINNSTSPDELKGVPIVQMLLTEVPRKRQEKQISSIKADLFSEQSLAITAHIDKLTKPEIGNLFVAINNALVAQKDDITKEQCEHLIKLMETIIHKNDNPNQIKRVPIVHILQTEVPRILDDLRAKETARIEAEAAKAKAEQAAAKAAEDAKIVYEDIVRIPETVAPASDTIAHFYGPNQNPNQLVVLSDVDETMILSHGFNDDYINGLIASGVKELYLFSSMEFGVTEVARISGGEGKFSPTRAELINYLKGKGIEVKGTFTTRDLFIKEILEGNIRMPTPEQFMMEINNPKSQLHAELRQLGTLKQFEPQAFQQAALEQYCQFMQKIDQIQASGGYAMGQLYELFIKQYEGKSAVELKGDINYQAMKYVIDHYVKSKFYTEEIYGQKQQEMYSGYRDKMPSGQKVEDVFQSKAFEKSWMIEVVQQEARKAANPMRNMILFDDVYAITAAVPYVAQAGASVSSVTVRNNTHAYMDAYYYQQAVALAQEKAGVPIPQTYFQKALGHYHQLLQQCADQRDRNALQRKNNTGTVQQQKSKLSRRLSEVIAEEEKQAKAPKKGLRKIQSGLLGHRNDRIKKLKQYKAFIDDLAANDPHSSVALRDICQQLQQDTRIKQKHGDDFVQEIEGYRVKFDEVAQSEAELRDPVAPLPPIDANKETDKLRDKLKDFLEGALAQTAVPLREKDKVLIQNILKELDSADLKKLNSVCHDIKEHDATRFERIGGWAEQINMIQSSTIELAQRELLTEGYIKQAEQHQRDSVEQSLDQMTEDLLALENAIYILSEKIPLQEQDIISNMTKLKELETKLNEVNDKIQGVRGSIDSSVFEGYQDRKQRNESQVQLIEEKAEAISEKLSKLKDKQITAQLDNKDLPARRVTVGGLETPVHVRTQDESAAAKTRPRSASTSTSRDAKSQAEVRKRANVITPASAHHSAKAAEAARAQESEVSATNKPKDERKKTSKSEKKRDRRSLGG